MVCAVHAQLYCVCSGRVATLAVTRNFHTHHGCEILANRKARHVRRAFLLCTSDQSSSTSPKLNRSMRLPMAGLFLGTYGLFLSARGFGRLSRLRSVRGFNPQFASMNFTTEA